MPYPQTEKSTGFNTVHVNKYKAQRFHLLFETGGKTFFPLQGLENLRQSDETGFDTVCGNAMSMQILRNPVRKAKG